MEENKTTFDELKEISFDILMELKKDDKYKLEIIRNSIYFWSYTEDSASLIEMHGSYSLEKNIKNRDVILKIIKE